VQAAAAMNRESVTFCLWTVPCRPGAGSEWSLVLARASAGIAPVGSRRIGPDAAGLRIMNGFGAFLASAICLIVRTDATGLIGRPGCLWRCPPGEFIAVLIKSQLVRLPPLRSLAYRHRTQLP